MIFYKLNLQYKFHITLLLNILYMLEFLIVYIFAMLGGRVFQQRVGISTVTNRAPLFADMFLYSYAQDLISGILKLAQPFNFKLHYIDGVLSLNTSKFGDYKPFDLDINDTIYTARSSHSFPYTSKLIVKKDNLRIFYL